MSKSKVVVTKTGTVAMIGKEAVNVYRLITILQGMKFELRTGMKLTNKAPSCFTIARREFGIRGNKAKLIEQMEEIVAQAKSQIPVEVEG